MMERARSSRRGRCEGLPNEHGQALRSMLVDLPAGQEDSLLHLPRLSARRSSGCASS